MNTYHLRPVNDTHHSPSPSPTNSSPHFKQPSNHSPTARHRRPLSPSSLRDVDLSQTPDMTQRKYPTPPTGHDLMAMFPPAPPDNFPEMRPGPTSGFFQRQERAFFAQAGKEIVRVRVEVDFPHGAVPELDHSMKARNPTSASTSSSSRPWMTGPPPPSSSIPSHSPVTQHPSSSSASSSNPNLPLAYPHGPPLSSRPSHRSGGVSSGSTPTSLYPTASPTAQHNATPTLLHQQQRTPPTQDMKPEYPSPVGGPGSQQQQLQQHQPEEGAAFDDEAWRRPMPYAERRRAGKHTRRVIVRT